MKNAEIGIISRSFSALLSNNSASPRLIRWFGSLFLLFMLLSTLEAYTPVMTPDGSTLPYEMDGDIKVYRLVAEPVRREFAPGIIVNCWGYNGQMPGPTIETVEGDRVRIYVTNHLPAPTSIHWHGILLPSNMDGVAGLSQPAIQPGETFVYEFTLRQQGTCMYHPHADEMTQLGLGLMGFFIIHPKNENVEKVDRDYAIMLQEWSIPAGAATPDTTVMTDFNYFTLNGKVFPGTSSLLAKRGERVRIRFGNLSMDSHPMHLHGFHFKTTGTGAGPIPKAAQVADVTVNVPVGSTRDIEFVADTPGDWLLHCHKTHHMMNGMTHGLPNMIGVKQPTEAIQRLIPGYMPMGEAGMTHMHHAMKGPPNMAANSSPGPFGEILGGGMETILKVRNVLDAESAASWYDDGKNR